MSRKSYEKIHQILTLTFKLRTNISGVLSLDGLSFIILRLTKDCARSNHRRCLFLIFVSVI